MFTHSLERGLEDLPVTYETLKLIVDYYLTSPEFATVDKYDRNSSILDREIGFLFIIGPENQILPVLRVCLKKEKEKDESGNGQD